VKVRVNIEKVEYNFWQISDESYNEEEMIQMNFIIMK
jgi:hypothetical protein